jgi:hypothetical protein
MALMASGLYRLSAEQLQTKCSQRELSSGGPVRVLCSRLTEYLKGGTMERKEEEQNIQASFPAGMLNTGSGTSTPLLEEGPQGGSVTNGTEVLNSLLQQVKAIVIRRTRGYFTFLRQNGQNL